MNSERIDQIHGEPKINSKFQANPNTKQKFKPFRQLIKICSGAKLYVRTITKPERSIK